jgi:hypothetical protein
MARNDTRAFTNHFADRAHLRTGTESWRALANVAVASTLVVAVVVSGLALCEAVFSNSATKLARHGPGPTGPRSWHARAATHEPFLPTPVQAEPVLFAD